MNRVNKEGLTLKEWDCAASVAKFYSGPQNKVQFLNMIMRSPERKSVLIDFNY